MLYLSEGMTTDVWLSVNHHNVLPYVTAFHVSGLDLKLYIKLKELPETANKYTECPLDREFKMNRIHLTKANYVPSI